MSAGCPRSAVTSDSPLSACGRSSTCSASVLRLRGGSDALARRQTPVLAVFAEGDDGLQYIQDRIARAFRRARRGGLIDVTTVPGIDHPMHRHWKRPSMVDAISAWLDTVIPAASDRWYGRPESARRATGADMGDVDTPAGKAGAGPAAPSRGRVRRHVDHSDGARRGGKRYLPDRLGGWTAATRSWARWCDCCGGIGEVVDTDGARHRCGRGRRRIPWTHRHPHVRRGPDAVHRGTGRAALAHVPLGR